jgi:hypothetical protein
MSNRTKVRGHTRTSDISLPSGGSKEETAVGVPPMSLDEGSSEEKNTCGHCPMTAMVVDIHQTLT